MTAKVGDQLYKAYIANNDVVISTYEVVEINEKYVTLDSTLSAGLDVVPTEDLNLFYTRTKRQALERLEEAQERALCRVRWTVKQLENSLKKIRERLNKTPQRCRDREGDGGVKEGK